MRLSTCRRHCRSRQRSCSCASMRPGPWMPSQQIPANAVRRSLFPQLEGVLMNDLLPRDWREATLVGRMDFGEGPTPVVCRNGRVWDVSRAAPTTSALLNAWDSKVKGYD